MYGDRRGPVADLGKDDFKLLEDGKERKISFFSVNSARTLAKPGKPLARDVFTNRAERRGETPTGATVVLLDGINTDIRDQAFARRQFVRFLSQLRPEDRVAVYALGSTLRVLQDFTSDSSRLLAVLERYSGDNLSRVEASEPRLSDTGDPVWDNLMNHTPRSDRRPRHRQPRARYRRRPDGDRQSHRQVARPQEPGLDHRQLSVLDRPVPGGRPQELGGECVRPGSPGNAESQGPGEHPVRERYPDGQPGEGARRFRARHRPRHARAETTPTLPYTRWTPGA